MSVQGDAAGEEGADPDHSEVEHDEKEDENDQPHHNKKHGVGGSFQSEQGQLSLDALHRLMDALS